MREAVTTKKKNTRPKKRVVKKNKTKKVAAKKIPARKVVAKKAKKVKDPKYVCQECAKEFKPKRKPRKKVVCPSCQKKPTKFNCVECGAEEKPTKHSRKKSFLCKGCRKKQKVFNKVLSDKTSISVENITEYLIEKQFELSPSGIPYKHYGGIRVSVGDICGKPLFLVKSRAESNCYIDSSIIKALPKDAVIELKPIINTIKNLWGNKDE